MHDASGFSVNYWCLECMCKRPAVKRAARIYPNELEKVLGGSELLLESDIARICNLLKMKLPDEAALANMKEGRKRSTRSGRKFGNWGGDEPDQEGAADSVVPVNSSTSKRSKR